jgi:hypothetical protein
LNLKDLVLFRSDSKPLDGDVSAAALRKFTQRAAARDSRQGGMNEQF